jgi:hypothetical protein
MKSGILFGGESVLHKICKFRFECPKITVCVWPIKTKIKLAGQCYRTSPNTDLRPFGTTENKTRCTDGQTLTVCHRVRLCAWCKERGNTLIISFTGTCRETKFVFLYLLQQMLSPFPTRLPYIGFTSPNNSSCCPLLLTLPYMTPKKPYPLHFPWQLKSVFLGLNETLNSKHYVSKFWTAHILSIHSI